MVRRLQVGVIGGSSPPPQILKDAKNIGMMLGRLGVVVLNGGLGGVMKAVSEGASKYNTEVVGIIPYYDRGKFNEFATIQIATGMGIARNVIIVASSDVVIAIDGSWGTLSEISFAKNLGIPVVGYKIPWKIDGVENFTSVDDVIERAIKLGEMKREGIYEESSYFSEWDSSGG